MVLGILLSVVVLVPIIVWFLLKYRHAVSKHEIDKVLMQGQIRRATVEAEAAHRALDSIREQVVIISDALKKARGKNKSIEVRTGQIMEKMAPFLELFRHDPKTAQFLGQPIDYIVFGDDEIVFVEVKTGSSKTTKTQNKIKKLVEAGKVRFELVRFDSK